MWDLNLYNNNFILATLHRSENVDNKERLNDIISVYNQISVITGKEIIVSTHPRTKSKLSQLMITIYDKVRFLPAFGFFDFVHLERYASCLLTDSGTCQEESAILHTPCIVTRRATERPELIECGASILGGVKFLTILNAYKNISSIEGLELPKEYTDLNVSNKVINILKGETNV